MEQWKDLPVSRTGSRTCLLDLSAPYKVVETEHVTLLRIRPLRGTTRAGVFHNWLEDPLGLGACSCTVEAVSDLSVLQNLGAL